MARLRESCLIEQCKDPDKIRKVIEEMIRRGLEELVAGESAGGNGDGVRPDGPGAGDVVWRVAEDVNLFGGKIAPAPFQGARTGETPQFVPVMMIIGEGAELEIVPHAVMRQLQLRTACEVPGEQTDNDVIPLFQCFEQLENAWQQTSWSHRKQHREPVKVAVEKRGQILRGLGDAMFSKDLLCDPGIGASGDVDLFEIVIDSETVFETENQCPFTGSATRQKSAVDIE
jgi:hypothetical protein